MIVYHYTDGSGYHSITSTGQFTPSTQDTTMDAAYGTGWYFTKMEPHNCDYTLMQVCWQRTNVSSRIAYYLKFEIPDWLLRQCGQRNVYVLDRWDANAIKHLGGGAKTVCSLKPCSGCTIFKTYYAGR